MPAVAGWKGTTLRRSAKAPRQARQAVGLWLADDHPTLRSNALLVVSELVTNVVVHMPAGAPHDWVKVRLGLADDFVRLEVTDPGTATPEPSFRPVQVNSLESSGRGLCLVASLSVRCGTQRIECGHRVVWADLTAAEVRTGDASAEWFVSCHTTGKPPGPSPPVSQSAGREFQTSNVDAGALGLLTSARWVVSVLSAVGDVLTLIWGAGMVVSIVPMLKASARLTECDPARLCNGFRAVSAVGGGVRW
ncbi:ATP-binding protein [Nonomuraea fuscirosea]|uniref:ATP-binding protein n=1 Tax=Nonomuraea fuscirosea TaxID=1291556 RepID=UPI00378C05C7